MRNFTLPKGKKWCLNDKVKLNEDIGFISGFSVNMVYVQDIDGKCKLKNILWSKYTDDDMIEDEIVIGVIKLMNPIDFVREEMSIDVIE